MVGRHAFPHPDPPFTVLGLGTATLLGDAILTEPSSSDQAEGQIDRLRLIERQSYGPVELDRLQRRVALAACSTRGGREPRAATLDQPVVAPQREQPFGPACSGDRLGTA